MGFFSRAQQTIEFPWIPLQTEAELSDVLEHSNNQPILIFKHSTRCSISSMALDRFINQWDKSNQCVCYFLDLIAYRSVSNAVEARTGVIHQSPQVIVLWKSHVIYDASHNGISANEIKEELKKLTEHE
jgi:bacillithiol system protein YtxJ